MSRPNHIEYDVPVGALTTFAVGGHARWLAVAKTEAEVVSALRWAAEAKLKVLILGGGSNLLVADSGFEGLVLCPRLEGRTATLGADTALVRIGAGEIWDEVVADCTAQGWAGIECLSGIPGRAGAAPIQNIGAYGQQVADVIESVRIVRISTGEIETLDRAACRFGYRSSRLKDEADSVVLALSLRLHIGGPPTLKYPQLKAQVSSTPSLAAVRDAVLSLRRSKSMVYDPQDPNHRSAGSFFLNPVVDAAQLAAVEQRVLEAGLEVAKMPRYPASSGVKLSAAWLIERAGFTRGHGTGRVGLSTRHTLALVNRGGATAAEVVQFAAIVRRQVFERLGVALAPEPVFVGFGCSGLAALQAAAPL